MNQHNLCYIRVQVPVILVIHSSCDPALGGTRNFLTTKFSLPCCPKQPLICSDMTLKGVLPILAINT